MIRSEPHNIESNLYELGEFQSPYGHETITSKISQSKMQSSPDIEHANLRLSYDSYINEQTNDSFMPKHCSAKELINYRKSKIIFERNALKSNSPFRNNISKNEDVSLFNSNFITHYVFIIYMKIFFILSYRDFEENFN